MCLPPTATPRPPLHGPDPIHLLAFFTALQGRTYDEAETLVSALEAAASEMDTAAAETPDARLAAAGVR